MKMIHLAKSAKQLLFFSLGAVMLIAATTSTGCTGGSKEPTFSTQMSAEGTRRQQLAADIVEEDMKAAKEVELIALNPDPHPIKSLPNGKYIEIPREQLLKGYLIVAQTRSSDHEEIKQLARALTTDIRSANSFGPFCFNPRHAIRYKKNGKVRFIRICFECGRGDVCEQDSATGDTDHSTEVTEFSLQGSAEISVNTIFAIHGLPKTS